MNYHKTAWVNMIQRCYNKNAPNYVYYGARGIRVCDRWRGKAGLANFIVDMGDRPTALYSLDRIDNDGDYILNNCKWSTRKQQQNNRRIYKNNKTNCVGVFWNTREKRWEVVLRSKYLGRFTDLAEAIKAAKGGRQLRLF